MERVHHGILMRDMVEDGYHLACVSKAQAAPKIERGIVTELSFPGRPLPGPIGLTLRRGWQPTLVQRSCLAPPPLCTLMRAN